jgi:AraC-like DNA-binding protein
MVLFLCAMLFLAGCTRQGAGEQSESLKEAYEDYSEGIAYDQAWQFRLAELYYGKVYRSLKDNPAEDWWLYGESAFRYAHMLSSRGDMGNAVAVLGDALAQAQDNEDFPDAQHAILLTKMAYCQKKLNHCDASRQSYDKAYKIRVKELGGECTGNINMVVLCDCAFISIFEMGEYADAAMWLRRADAELEAFIPHGDSATSEEYRGQQTLYRVRLLQATGHPAEAAATFAALPERSILSPMNSHVAVQYLMDARRYGEAADLYATIDTAFGSFNPSHITLDVLQEEFFPRYTVLRRAGRTAEALVVADSITRAIDSALAWQKHNDAAELSFIYQTHEKEIALEKSRTKSTIYLTIAVGALLLLLLVGYTLWRVHRYNRLLTEKNRILYKQIQQRKQAEADLQDSKFRIQNPELSQSQQLFRRLCTIMTEQQPYTDETLNRDMLAQLLGTNAKYVEQAIHECSNGDTVTGFITRYRLEHVARLLKTTDDPISIIGEQAGIPSRATLARLFRNTYGMTCSEFRKAAR